MGQQKLLLPLGNRPVIARCIESLEAAGIDPIIVVTGPEGSAVREALRYLPVTGVTNPKPGSEMADSVRAGFAAVSDAVSSVFVCPGDYPLVSPATFAAMKSVFREDPGIIVPRYLGKKGHPVLFPRALLAEIGIEPTMRDILRKHPGDVRMVDIYDEGVVIDMDTPEDYRDVRFRFHAANAAALRDSRLKSPAGAVNAGPAGVPR